MKRLAIFTLILLMSMTVVLAQNETNVTAPPVEEPKIVCDSSHCD